MDPSQPWVGWVICQVLKRQLRGTSLISHCDTADMGELIRLEVVAGRGRSRRGRGQGGTGAECWRPWVASVCKGPSDLPGNEQPLLLGDASGVGWGTGVSVHLP